MDATDGNSLSWGALLGALSRALDLSEGQPPGHAARSAAIGLRLADTIGLDDALRDDLQRAILLKDGGCSSNAAKMFALFGGDELVAKRNGKIIDWCRPMEAMRYGLGHATATGSMLERFERVLALARTPGRVMDALTAARCERGADIARTLGLSETVADAIYFLDEHWDGDGAPTGISGDSIPILARIACLAQTLEVFAATFGHETALQIARKRAGSWFDPALADAAQSLKSDCGFWNDLESSPEDTLDGLTSGTLRQPLAGPTLDSVCEAFAQIVDAKSPFTGGHSRRVAIYAVAIAHGLELDPARTETLRRAALLHDLGKLAVPNHILEKPGPLDDDEWLVMRQHPGWTESILGGVPALERIARIAGAHHERLDGNGYHRGVDASGLDAEMRILAAADIFDAITSMRPYRAPLSPALVRQILRQQSGSGLDPACVEILREQTVIAERETRIDPRLFQTREIHRRAA